MTHAISCDSLITWQNVAKVTLCLSGIALIAWGGTNYSQLKGIISMSAGGTLILGTAIYQVVNCLKSPRYKDPNLYDYAGRPFPPEYLARRARPPKEPYEVKEALVPEQPSAATVPKGLARRREVYQRISLESHPQNKQGVSRIHVRVIRTHLLGCLSLCEIDSLSRTCRHLFESVYGTCDLDKHLESHRTFDRHFQRVVSILLHKMPCFADLTSRLPLLNRIEFSGTHIRLLFLLSGEDNPVNLPKLEGVKTLTFNDYITTHNHAVNSNFTAFLRCCPNVTSLNFDHCQFHEKENLKRWVLTFKETLTQLSLTHASSAEVISDAIASFGACQQLQVFVLSNLLRTGENEQLDGNRFLAFARGCTELTHLDLSHNPFVDKYTIETIFTNFPKLTALNLSSTNPRFILAPEILEKLEGKNLEELHMSRSWIDHHSMQHFNSGRTFCFSEVTRLYFGECELLTMDDFQWVVKYINTGMSKHPTHLSLPGAAMTDDQFKKLMRSKHGDLGPVFCRDLEELTLHNCHRLTNMGIAKGLGECQRLKKAEIRGARNVTPAVIEDIADISVDAWFANKAQLLSSGRPFAQMETIIIANTDISGREKRHEIGRPIRIICAIKAAMKCMRRSDSKGLGIKIVRSSPNLTHLINVDSDSLPKRLEEELAAFKKQDPVFNTSWD